LVTVVREGPGNLEPHIRKRGKWYTMSGKTDRIKGRIKEAAGTLTGDKDLKSEGKTDRRAGEVKQTLDHAKGKVEEFIDKAADKSAEVIDKIKGAPGSK
jgi:uncharacterized protein YjbJ (UPF0337 family)